MPAGPEQFARGPQLVAGDAAFYSADNEAAQQMGGRQISVPDKAMKVFAGCSDPPLKLKASVRDRLIADMESQEVRSKTAL